VRINDKKTTAQGAIWMTRRPVLFDRNKEIGALPCLAECKREEKEPKWGMMTAKITFLQKQLLYS